MTVLNYITEYDDINLQKDDENVVHILNGITSLTPTVGNNDDRGNILDITPVVSSLSKFERIEQLKNELKLLQDEEDNIPIKKLSVKKSSVKINHFYNTIDNSVF